MRTAVAGDILMISIFWFRRDLRLADNLALHQALHESKAVIPLFVWTPEDNHDWSPGAAKRWWLHRSLSSLQRSLEQRGSRLILKQGNALSILRTVMRAVGASAVYCNSCYEPGLRQRDAQIASALLQDGRRFESFPGRILHDPDEIQTTSGGPYHVFTPFWKKFVDTADIPPVLGTPDFALSEPPERWPGTGSLDSLRLNQAARINVDQTADMESFWSSNGPGGAPGETDALNRLDSFMSEHLSEYDTERDRPDRYGTSFLSPRLHHGELSPRQVWHAVRTAVHQGASRKPAEVFLKQLAWREFSYHLLYHYPNTTREPLRNKFRDFEWQRSEADLARWQRGQTGYPIVDAAMRQLWHIGWMHNRLRMIVASFLTKDLLIPWQDGAAWFWDTLVDADLANNTMGWQWAAGCGADAQPFFRIFNPVSQGKKHDPDGYFLREWIPELKDLPTRYLHDPWTASTDVLHEAGVVLGETYPHPIVDHSEARDEALKRYNAIK